MTVRTFSLIALFFLLLCTIPSPGQAQEIQYREEPMALEEMEDYKDIPFRQDNFEKIAQGMSAKDVLTLARQTPGHEKRATQGPSLDLPLLLSRGAYSPFQERSGGGQGEGIGKRPLRPRRRTQAILPAIRVKAR